LFSLTKVSPESLYSSTKIFVFWTAQRMGQKPKKINKGNIDAREGFWNWASIVLFRLVQDAAING